MENSVESPNNENSTKNEIALLELKIAGLHFHLMALESRYHSNPDDRYSGDEMEEVDRQVNDIQSELLFLEKKLALLKSKT